MNKTDFESALNIDIEKLLRKVNRLDDRHTEEGIELGARWAHDLLNEEIEKLKAERDNLSRREIEVASCCVANEEDAKAWKEQAEALAGALEFYNSRTVYELLNQFQGDNTYSECHGVASGALTAYNKFKERQATRA